MKRGNRARAFRLAAAAIAVAVVALPRGGRAEGLKEAPLAGIVRAAKGVAPAGGEPLAGIELLVHGLSAPIASFSRVVRTAADGTWVVPAAPAGLYAISSLAAGFRPAVARLWHRAEGTEVSFVTLELERGGGVLPPTPLGAGDPWLARALASGDVLREEDPAAADTGAPSLPAGFGAPAVVAADLRVPIRASVSSMTGFAAAGGAAVSGTSVDVNGSLGPSLRWGVEGQYRRLGGDEGALGNASRLTVDVAPGDQAIRVSARRQSLAEGGDDPARFAAQAIDWSASTGDRSRASVSARMTSESNLLQRGPAADLFARASSAFEVEARYRTESEAGNFVRVAVGYRSLSVDGAAIGSPFDRETRLGGAAGVQLTRALSFEAGATGDVSNLVRGLTPELTITLRTPQGIKVYGFVSRRFERRLLEESPLARAGTDEADLSRLSRALYRAGIRWDDASGGSVALEASQRELAGTFRLLLDPEFLDNLDSLYFLEGDVAREVSGSGTFRIARGLQGRLSAKAGMLSGERTAAIARDRARYTVAQAAVRVGATGSSLGVGYRVVAQELERLADLRQAQRNEIAALEFTLAQTLPFPFLRSLGSEWRALFSLELGRRQEAEAESRSNRRLAGGLAFAF